VGAHEGRPSARRAASMLLLEGVALTDSGRPVLAPEELELRILEKTDAEFGERRGGLQRWARLWYASSKILP